MRRDYKTWTLTQLLIALEQSGRHPSPDLIRTLLADPPGLRPVLLQWLAAPTRSTWYPDDDIWFRTIHAGFILIALQETEALPLFAQLYRNPKLDDLTDWFETDISAYGPAAVDWAFELLNDRDAAEYPRWNSSEMLFAIGANFPEARDRVIRGLRAYLPELKPDGTLALSAAQMAAPDPLYAWVAMALAHLRDTDSRELIETMYRHNLIDLTLMGDRAEYVHILTQEIEVPQTPQPYDLVARYREVFERDRKLAILSRASRVPTEGEILAQLGSTELAIFYQILQNR